MDDKTSQRDKGALDAQRQHWESTFANKPSMFGDAPSSSALAAVEVFQREGVRKLLELGAGQGRDTIFFAQNGFHVTALEYSSKGIEAITTKAELLGLSRSISVARHDVRIRLPFDDESFDGCYSHMLFCMALTTRQLELLSQETRRVLRPGGVNIYTVRHTGDPQYGTGTHRGEDMYEIEGGFVVHFFTRQKVEQLAQGYEIVSIDDFEEGGLPKKLLRVTLKKH
jgi:SAM-dependent methyltransferase